METKINAKTTVKFDVFLSKPSSTFLNFPKPLQLPSTLNSIHKRLLHLTKYNQANE
jgi:hypothetical protein